MAVDDPQLLDHPVAFIHGRRDFQWTAKQRKALATYLERGGFLFGDAICASPQFATALRREIQGGAAGREVRDPARRPSAVDPRVPRLRFVAVSPCATRNSAPETIR